MKKNYTSLLSLLFLSGIICWIYYATMPQWAEKKEGPLAEFSTQRALEKIKIISAQPHYAGSENHKAVARYIETELQQLGLETQVQDGTTLSDWGNLVKSHNIMARIKGTTNSKALLLLSHYDSAPHSFSHGAADDASGVAVILESVRAFLHNKTAHKNDIIILFTDAEELGLNGAALFVTKSPWAKDIGLALNFEARGTAGPGYMLMEVNHGNAGMVKGFSEANLKYPVSNSLMYSIYKMLPNDTDLTVFREQGKIQGFNFAFIDNHFNYHTAQDDLQHLSRETLAHQGENLMPLLYHFANADLGSLNTSEDEVYFNTPLNFMHYPFSWNVPLLVIAAILFLFLVFIGMGKRILMPALIGKGFVLFSCSLVVAAVVTFFGWKGMLALYPEYLDILQGFTYNGHAYIAAFIFLSLSCGFLFYANVKSEAEILNYSVAPLFLWLVINLMLVLFLPGAGFFILPVLSALLVFAFFIITQRGSKFLNLLLAIPALVIFVPFITAFPIGLGLKMLAGSAALVVLVFGLLLPVFASFTRKGLWSALFFLTSIGFFIYAHLNSNYEPGKAKPNSLLYVYDAGRDKAVWATYDRNLDEWTKTYLTENPENADFLNTMPLFSKYDSKFTYTAEALVRELPEPDIDFLKDSVIGTQRYLKIRITPNRKVNRYDIFAAENMHFHNLKANGASALGQKESLYPRNGKKIISYYVVDNEPLELQFSIAKNTVLDMELMESSFDLMTNPAFQMAQRKPWMMPTPFVLNNAIVIKKKIKPGSSVIVPMPVRKNFSLSNTSVNDTIADPDAGSLEDNAPQE